MVQVPRDATGWARCVGIAALVGPVVFPTGLLLGAVVSAVALGGSIGAGVLVAVVLTAGVGLLVASELDWQAIPVAWAGALAGSVLFGVAVAASEALLPVASEVPFVDAVRELVRFSSALAFGAGFGSAVALTLAIGNGWVPVTRGATVVAVLAFPGAAIAASLAPWPTDTAAGFVTMLLGLVAGAIPAIALEVGLARRVRTAVS